jgi:hypothetical protein
MTGSLDDPQKAVNVSLWESREDMDGYYQIIKSMHHS